MGPSRKAAFMTTPGESLAVEAVEAHHARPGEVAIKIQAIVLQPLDTKILIAGYGPASQLNFPAVLGSSGAGVVEELGEGVTEFEIGDTGVFDTTAYVKIDENRRTGTWQQSAICDVRTIAKIGGASFEQAALVDFPLQTAVAALHVFLGMGMPGTGTADQKVLIWGAGGAVGSYAVQFAKQVGHTVVATASPRDFERQKKLGVSEVVDYKAADAVEQLRKFGPYKYLFTASGDPTSQKALATLLEPEGGKFASVLPGTIELPPNVDMIYTAYSQAAQKDEYSDWRNWWYKVYLPEVFEKGLVEQVKFTKVQGGLSALQQASQDVFDGKVRGKLVINPQE